MTEIDIYDIESGYWFRQKTFDAGDGIPLAAAQCVLNSSLLLMVPRGTLFWLQGFSHLTLKARRADKKCQPILFILSAMCANVAAAGLSVSQRSSG